MMMWGGCPIEDMQSISCTKKLVHKALEVPDFNNIQEAMISLASAERIGVLVFFFFRDFYFYFVFYLVDISLFGVFF